MSLSGFAIFVELFISFLINLSFQIDDLSLKLRIHKDAVLLVVNVVDVIVNIVNINGVSQRCITYENVAEAVQSNA